MKRDWFYFAGFVVVILSTLPVARPINDWLIEINGGVGVGSRRTWLLYSVLVLCAAGVGLGIILRRKRPVRAWVWLAILATIGAGFMSNAWAKLTCPDAPSHSLFWLWPIERIHFAEYGFLAYLAFRALRNHVSFATACLLGVAIVAAIGFVDEGAQYFIPGRYFDPRDILVNALAGTLGIVTVVFMRRRGAEGNHVAAMT